MQKRLLTLVLLLSWPCLCQKTGAATQTLSVSLGAYAVLSTPTNSTLNNTGAFTSYTSTFSVSYKARTTNSGTLSLQAGSDFSPAGGPSIASGNLTYTCASATLGTACTGTQTVSKTSSTTVVSMGAGAFSGSSPSTVSLTFTVPDSGSYNAGTYNVSLTFSFSLL